MTTVLLIIGACILVAGAVSFATGAFNSSSKEEQLPIENPEVAKPTVVKNKKAAKKPAAPKKKAPKKELEA